MTLAPSCVSPIHADDSKGTRSFLRLRSLKDLGVENQLRLAMENDLIYAGKTIDELSIEELRVCALHFRAAHVKQMLDAANMLRRMEKMELALDKNARAKLDWWLENRPNDTCKGDGTAKYPEWTEFEPTADGYQIPNKSRKMERSDAYLKRKNL